MKPGDRSTRAASHAAIAVSAALLLVGGVRPGRRPERSAAPDGQGRRVEVGQGHHRPPGRAHARRTAPARDRTRIVRKLRSELPKPGYEVTSYREFKSASASSVFRARSKKDDYNIEAETVGSGKTKPRRFSFAVRTPCMLPPGAKQQQF